MKTLDTILPFFLLIFVGSIARKKGFVPDQFQGPANRLIYYFAIPAMIFRSTSQASLNQEFHLGVLIATLSASASTYGITWLYCWLKNVRLQRASALIQSAGHGNLGYLGLPFSLYFLGESGLVKTALIASVLVILQNFLSVFALQMFSENGPDSGNKIIRVFTSLGQNPVILASLAGILVSGSGLPVPGMLARFLEMLGSMAPPMALLLIGAALNFRSVRGNWPSVCGAVFMKLFFLPALGLLIFKLFEFPAENYLPGLVLLACPIATVTYVMAKEMKGDPEFVVSTISASTLFSVISFTFWMEIVLG